jgi:predicted RecB family nuclease
MAISISKSRFMAGMQCLKRLYLLVHQPEFGRGKTGADFALMDQGRQVGKLAQRLFPGGIEVSTGDHDEAIRITRELIANPDVPAIFEAGLEFDGVFVRVDILHRRKDGRWRLIEVKSSASMKDEHVEDVAIQYRVVSKCGVNVASCYLATVNRQYVFPGGGIDPWRFFRIRNLTRKVLTLQPKLTFQLRSEFRVLAMPAAPDIPTGKHCVQPVVCEFYDHCNSPRPDEHIGYLPYIHANAVEELEEMGVDSIRDIPDDFELTEIQRRAATCVQTGEPWFDGEGLNQQFEKLEYPIYFLDFETVNWAIPRFAGMRAYDQLPFQWSVHVQRRPGAEPDHHEFLSEDRSDPRLRFISSLSDVLDERGSILVYSSFESQRLADLAAWLPEFREWINAIQDRLFDLLSIVREYTYHPAYAGSYSIKSVLPALVPEMSYVGMEVSNGQDAGLAWETTLRTSDRAERVRLRKALLDYCGQDTLALVRLVDRLLHELH